jgi:hypothetical protein
MILVDTSVWAAYFNGAPGPEVDHLEGLLAAEDKPIAILPIILTEVLQGFRTDSGFRQAAAVLRGLVVLEPTLGTHERAAGLFRALRKKGVTVRGAVDALIAQTCIETGVGLLSLDKDFVRIARHTALRRVVA